MVELLVDQDSKQRGARKQGQRCGRVEYSENLCPATKAVDML